MAKKLVVRSSNDEVWVIDLNASPPTIRELAGDERTRMIASLTHASPLIRVENAILGDDVTEIETGTGHEKIRF